MNLSHTKWSPRLLRLVACVLVPLMGASCADAIVGEDKVRNGAALFDELWTEVDEHYSFFDLKRINWDSLRVVYRPKAAAATNNKDLAKVLGQLLAELRDPHVALIPFGAGSTMRYLGRADTSRSVFSASGVNQQYMPAVAFNSQDVVRAAMITPSVGYLHIASFHGQGWGSSVDSALKQLAEATSLIVDVRDNRGGTYSLAVDIAGRFVRQRQTFGYLRFRNGPDHSNFSASVAETVEPTGITQFRGPIYLLANGRTVSSAEVFVLALRSNAAVTVVGDTTAGASGGPTPRQLSNGWIFELSEWIEYTPQFKSYEGIGLAPDVVVAPTTANFLGKDAAMERALVLANTSR